MQERIFKSMRKCYDILKNSKIYGSIFHNVFDVNVEIRLV